MALLMAGDWIKMRCDLDEDPAVIAMADKLQRDEYDVVGRLHALWSWADRQSRDGHAPRVTQAWIDRHVRCDGFAAAMVEAGWLEVAIDGITFPDFDRHNGKTAKERALSSNRQQKRRDDSVTFVTPESRLSRDGGVTREEKRREEKDLKILASSPAGSTPFHEELNLSPVFIELPLNTGRPWAVREALVAEWQTLFPSVDVRQQLRSMRAWLDANRSRRKTARGIKAFAARWLAKDQDRGPLTGKPRSGAGELGAKEFD